MNKIAKKIVVFVLVISAGAMGPETLGSDLRDGSKNLHGGFLLQNEESSPTPLIPASHDHSASLQRLRRPLTTIYGWPSAPIELPRMGANFMMTSPGGLGGTHLFLRFWRLQRRRVPGPHRPGHLAPAAGTEHPQSALVFIQNNYATPHAANFTITASQVDAQHRKGFETFNTHTAPASITVGDFNGDGKLDFFFMRNRVRRVSPTNFLAAMYINNGTLTIPNFSPRAHVPEPRFHGQVPDGRDLRQLGRQPSVLRRHRQGQRHRHPGRQQDKIYLVRNPGAAQAGNLANWIITELNYNQRDGFTGDRGGSAISAADFDKDGSIEIVVGTVNQEFSYLAYYENDGQGHFTRMDLAIPARLRRDVRRPVGHLDQGLQQRRLAGYLRRRGRRQPGNPPAHMWMHAQQGPRGPSSWGEKPSNRFLGISSA